jgi:hypothetical protein
MLFAGILAEGIAAANPSAAAGSGLLLLVMTLLMSRPVSGAQDPHPQSYRSTCESEPAPVITISAFFQRL